MTKRKDAMTLAEYRSTMSEAAFQQRVIDIARAFGWKVAAFRKVRVQRKNGSVYYETPVQADGKGWPDLVLCRGERILYRELKVGYNKQTEEQIAWMSWLMDAGQDVDLWHVKDMASIEEELT